MNYESKKSPIKNKSYAHLQNQKKQIVNQLLYLFTYYCGKNSKYSYKYIYGNIIREINQKYFMKLMIDIWQIASKQDQLRANSIMWRNLQNVYYSVGRRLQMQFQQFLKTIPDLSVYLEPQLDRQNAMKSFLYYMSSLYENMILPELKTNVLKQQGVIHPQTRQFIMKLLPDLNKLYKIYFSAQINHKIVQKSQHYLSFNTYLQFMKDFQIYPKLISASLLYFIYSQNLHNHSKDLLLPSQYSKQVIIEAGQIFKLSKFIQSFIALSQVCLYKLKQIDDPENQEWQDSQKKVLKILFEYMQTVKQTKSKKCKFTEHRFSLIIYQQYPQITESKTYIINQKIIKQPLDRMNFYDILQKINL